MNTESVSRDSLLCDVNSLGNPAVQERVQSLAKMTEMWVANAFLQFFLCPSFFFFLNAFVVKVGCHTVFLLNFLQRY